MLWEKFQWFDKYGKGAAPVKPETGDRREKYGGSGPSASWRGHALPGQAAVEARFLGSGKSCVGAAAAVRQDRQVIRARLLQL